VREALLDFSERRPDIWPGLERSLYEVYAVGATTADVREGSKMPGMTVWAREHYDWSEGDTIRWTVAESNFCTPGSYVAATLHPREGGGTRVHVEWDRTGTTRAGRFAVRMVTLTKGRPVAGSIERWGCRPSRVAARRERDNRVALEESDPASRATRGNATGAPSPRRAVEIAERALQLRDRERRQRRVGEPAERLHRLAHLLDIGHARRAELEVLGHSPRHRIVQVPVEIVADELDDLDARQTGFAHVGSDSIPARW
jgi:hypothetical protein